MLQNFKKNEEKVSLSNNLIRTILNIKLFNNKKHTFELSLFLVKHFLLNNKDNPIATCPKTLGQKQQEV